MMNKELPSSPRSLKWTRLPSDGVLFHCVEHGKKIGTLQWERGNTRDGLAQMPSGGFLLRRAGFWSQYRMILAADSGVEEARLIDRWRGRLLRIPNAPSYVMTHTAKRVPTPVDEWCFSDAGGTRIIRFHDADLRKGEFELSVEIADTPIDPRQLDIALVAGLFWVLFDLVLRAEIVGMDASLASIATSSR